MAVTMNAVDGTDDHELDHRALTEYMAVLEDGNARAKRAPGLYTVTTQSGATYLVDPDLPACQCDDHRYRGRRCKHIRRVRFALGWRPVPVYVDEDDVDPQLGIHVRDDGDEDEADEDAGRDREEPTRSEPADFGHGESTGVQDL